MSFTSTLTVLALATIVTSASFPTTCRSFDFSESDVAPVVTLGTHFFSAGARVEISNLFSSIDSTHLPAFCRVQLAITTNTTAGSTALAEVWLPEDWNGRFLAVGNGGFGGGVTVEDLGFIAVDQGFAGVSTDTGHNSTSNDASWALNNDNAIVDWSWRAMRLSVQVGKELVEQFYGRPQDKSYYLGCSTGGRQGLKEVQRFPEDFDGVVIGSPANWMTHVQPWGLHQNLLVLPVNSSHWIPADMWTGLIHDEVLKQCDALDGLADGILNDPMMCNFDPAPISCAPNTIDTSACLTPLQVDAMVHALSDYIEVNNTFIFNGYYLGGELDYPDALVGDQVFEIALGYERFFVMNDSSWNETSLDLSVIELGDRLDVGTANAIDPNITAFVGPSHNGKIIHYVGLADQLISPGNSKLYHASVAQFMLENSGADVDDFYRLFTVPGMKHCKEGLAANAFGGAMQASSGQPPLSNSPENNILQALVAWVENGTAPTQFTAAHYISNKHENGIDFIRPICKFPMQLRFTGGDTTVASSFSCV